MEPHGWSIACLTAAGLILLACSDTGRSDGTMTPIDSGAVEAEASVLAQEICPAACAAAQKCSGKIELAACESQCAVELSGGGYLALEIAEPYFKHLAEVKDDTGCQATDDGPWPFTWAHPEEFVLPDVGSPEVVAECTKALAPCVENASAAQPVCFRDYYWFNFDIRSKMKSCFALPCEELRQCRCEQAIAGMPWVAIPRDESELCPPLK